MKFCRFCGKQLEDGAVCDCAASAQASSPSAYASGNMQQPAAYNQYDSGTMLATSPYDEHSTADQYTSEGQASSLQFGNDSYAQQSSLQYENDSYAQQSSAQYGNYSYAQQSPAQYGNDSYAQQSPAQYGNDSYAQQSPAQYGNDSYAQQSPAQYGNNQSSRQTSSSYYNSPQASQQIPPSFGVNPGAPMYPNSNAVRQGVPQYNQQAMPPAQESKFSRAMKNIPELFKFYWKDGSSTVETVKGKEDNVIIAALFTGIFFIALVISSCFYIKASEDVINEILDELFIYYSSAKIFNFGRIIFSSLILTVVIAILYVFIKFIVVKVCSDKTNPALLNNQLLLVDAFIEFSVNSIPVSIAVVIAGLFMYISPIISTILMFLAPYFLVVTLVSEIKTAIPRAKNNFVFTLITSLLIAIGLIIVNYTILRTALWSSGILDMINNALDRWDDILDLF